ncbi:FMN-dependent NADH-azoreductase [Lentzea cavernae]|uniref:FMN dependent NADH:quinone oxidoreductase n=1 Tax=Lentzea cavernae TaxID=2020703 RepID=A0ABQ3MQF0_9PSEU|nr:NAD(P)H-dependent oxidoreductase [Lentzea cavernae]GHH47961.1 FMN-dependent NADH-azoreductase [Lentzea cavernae]
MATLLHVDSSVFPADASHSRSVAAAFRHAWEEQHPDGVVIHRDLAAAPVPHITAEGHLDTGSAAFAARLVLVDELERADAVLIGAPMYNFGIPSTLKAWLDNVILLGRTSGGTMTCQGKPVTVVASRGGSYEQGTPREGFEFVRNYLRAVLTDKLGLEVGFIVPELTMAPRNPAMSALVPLYEASRERALDEAVVAAKRL